MFDNSAAAKNRQQLIESFTNQQQEIPHTDAVIIDEDTSNPHYIFQDAWIKISEVEIPPSLSILHSEEFETQKKKLFEQISAPEKRIDFTFLTPLAEHLLQQQNISQVDILNNIIAFLRVPSHPWNQPNSSNIAYGVWSKANKQLLAFSNSFCEIHALSKTFLETHPFVHEDFSYIPDIKKYVTKVFELMFDCNIFYYESTMKCKSGAYALNRTYFIPNSLFFVSFYETCDYFSDCFVLDGLKFEPSFISKQSSLPLQQVMEYKFSKFIQILTHYRELFSKE